MQAFIGETSAVIVCANSVKMKRISDYFSSTSSKKAKPENDKPVDKPVDKPTESPTATGDSVKPADKRNFQTTWLTDAHFKDWLRFSVFLTFNEKGGALT